MIGGVADEHPGDEGATSGGCNEQRRRWAELLSILGSLFAEPSSDTVRPVGTDLSSSGAERMTEPWAAVDEGSDR